MANGKTKPAVKVLVVLTFLGMVTVNSLANFLPINGQTTGEVSESYPNLFAPAGLAFIIWGLIYFLLAGYTLYQLGFFQERWPKNRAGLLNAVGLYFSVSSLANTGWIFAWHYNRIGLSMLLMAVILVCLIQIARAINGHELSLREYLFIKLPFSVYFGWITVATIANATTLLVSLGWDGFGLSEATWAVIIILTGLVIAVATMLRFRDIAYGLVVIWAYSGIILKHTSASGFANQYPGVIAAAAISIVVLIAASFIVFRSTRATAWRKR